MKWNSAKKKKNGENNKEAAYEEATHQQFIEMSTKHL